MVSNGSRGLALLGGWPPYSSLLCGMDLCGSLGLPGPGGGFMDVCVLCVKTYRYRMKSNGPWDTDFMG
jgi:hypothetical protein